MNFGMIELKVTFKGGLEKKWVLPADREVNDTNMRGVIGATIKMMQDQDFPVVTDVDGRIFCLPNLPEIITLEIKEIK